jgi:hypothetical protein
MSKPIDHTFSDLPDDSDNDVASMIAKMQRQLLFLEKKIDILISKTEEKPSYERSSYKKPFQKSYRPPEHSRRYGNEDRGEGRRDKDSDQGFYSRYGKEGNRSVRPRKKPFDPKKRPTSRPFNKKKD